MSLYIVQVNFFNKLYFLYVCSWELFLYWWAFLLKVYILYSTILNTEKNKISRRVITTINACAHKLNKFLENYTTSFCLESCTELRICILVSLVRRSIYKIYICRGREGVNSLVYNSVCVCKVNASKCANLWWYMFGFGVCFVAACAAHVCVIYHKSSFYVHCNEEQPHTHTHVTAAAAYKDAAAAYTCLSSSLTSNIVYIAVCGILCKALALHFPQLCFKLF